MDPTSIRLNQSVIASGEARTFFFNGRLLSAEDLKREQGQREAGQRRLAQLVGCGIATGLGVEVGVSKKTTLSIKAGLGVTPSGEVIEVGDLELDLQTAPRPLRAGGFSACEAAFNSGALLAGLHLLVLTPTWISDGRALTLLGDVGACNRNVERPAVRARLVKLKDLTTDPNKRRNSLAYALLAPDPLSAEFKTTKLIGWWPGSIAPTLRGDDLPIAVVSINEKAEVEFLDVDAARRRLAPPPGNAADALWPESRTAEMEAFARQFLGHLSELKYLKLREQTVQFDWLPPVVVLNKEAKDRYSQVFSKTSAALPEKEHKVGRESFARALRDGLHGEPIKIQVNSVRAVLLKLGDSDSWLLRLRPPRLPPKSAP